ncbi:hypothetical protein [Pseudooctadecabacter sp.]|uniref:hypothetical protein n=1 Tax=Pseudooctadecabacter sp. TaxID=1966338 RepID=UPI0035C7B3DB
MFKTLSIALAALTASATVAAADVSYLSNFIKEQNRDSQVELGTVRAASDGVVEIFSFHKGEVGPLLGSEAVMAGANLDVDVDVRRPLTNVIAVLKVDGQIVDSQEIDFN